MFHVEQYWGKACFTYCEKYKFAHKHKFENCKKWKVDVYPLSDKTTHDIIEKAGYYLKK